MNKGHGEGGYILNWKDSRWKEMTKIYGDESKSPKTKVYA